MSTNKIVLSGLLWSFRTLHYFLCNFFPRNKHPALLSSSLSLMEETINAASQMSPASREVSDEVAETIEGAPAATDMETINNGKRKRDDHRPSKDEAHNAHADVKSSPVSLPQDVSDDSSMTRSKAGRPKGSGKLQILASIGGYFAASAGGNFCPYALTINPGEDMVRLIMSFATMPMEAVCILSATGVVSKVHIHTSNAQSVPEGSYHIIKMSGSYGCHKVGTQLYMTGGLSIQLAAPDGQLVCGLVVGSIIAKEPIQLIIGTFKQNIISDYIKRKHSLSAVMRDSEKKSNPKFVADENGNSTALEVEPLRAVHNGQAETTIFTESENAGASSPDIVDVNSLPLQVWQPTYWVGLQSKSIF